VLFHFLVALNSIDFTSRKRQGKGHGVNSLKKLRNSRNIVNVETKFKTTESTSLACQKVCMCELNPEEDEAQISTFETNGPGQILRVSWTEKKNKQIQT